MIVDIGVVIVTYNSVSMITGLLQSLPAAFSPLSGRVVVVDNGSSDGTAEAVSALGHEVVRESNRGYAAGVNRGAEVLVESCRYLLVLNPDVILSPGCIVPMVTAVRSPAVGIVVPKVLDEDGTVNKSLRREPTLGRALGLGRSGRPSLSEYVTDRSSYDSPGDFDWALGAVMLIDIRCWSAVGPWDETYFLYSEETDFCLRAGDVGWLTRYEPTSEVVHIGGQSGRNDWTHMMQIVNRVRLYGRRHRDFATVVYLALTVGSELSWVVRGHRQSVAAVRALLRPSRRPSELHCGSGLIPR